MSQVTRIWICYAEEPSKPGATNKIATVIAASESEAIAKHRKAHPGYGTYYCVEKES